ncbi:MAG: ATP-binding protein [Candidatus Pacebacteria bacterium]|nr:ATP-binding protein [Candidatus Paceibacterota bacterium]
MPKKEEIIKALEIKDKSSQEGLISIESCNVSNAEDLRRIRSAFLNIFEDVEETRRVAVREKNKTMLIIENLTDGLLVLDKNNKIEIINPIALQILKKSTEDLLGQNLFEVKFEEENIKKFLALIRNKNGNIKELIREEISIDERIFFQVSALPIMEGKKEKGYLIILHDISKDKMIDQMKTEFVSVAAHQLRTPLSAIKWTIKMLLDGDVGKLSDEQVDFLNKSYESNERMINLVNDLLNVSRIDEGRFIYKPEPLQIEDIFKLMTENVETIAEKKNLKLILDFPPSLLPPVFADREKMGIVVQNLIENSIKYTPPGGEIIISIEDMKDDLLIKIKDTGVGIPKDQQDRIFTKFFRGENVIKLETEGSGLGLYTVKNIVESHKGKIWFQSELDKGTTFFFTLPKFNKNINK